MAIKPGRDLLICLHAGTILIMAPVAVVYAMLFRLCSPDWFLYGH